MEVQITVQIHNGFEEAKKILENLGFQKKSEYLVEDSYFTHGENYSLFDIEGVIRSSILVRKLSGDLNEAYLVYKDKHYIEGENVSQDAIKTRIESYENARQIFLAAGLVIWAEVDDYVTVFKKDDLEISLQHLKSYDLLFLEIIRKVDSQSEEKIAVEQLKNIAKNLGLNLSNNFFCSKAQMAANLKNKNKENNEKKDEN